jgi:hypothetical protein
MATTGSNFVYVTDAGNSLLVGSAAIAPPFLVAMNPVQALELVNSKPMNTALPSYPGVCVDRLSVDLSLLPAQVPLQVGANQVAMGAYLGGYAKNGSVLLSFTGTTAQTILFTNTTTNTPAAYAGDTALATWYTIVFQNLSTSGNIVISPASSNPLLIPFGGTTPTYTLAYGDTCVWNSAAGQAVGSTHTGLTFTPTAGGILAVSFGGA